MILPEILIIIWMLFAQYSLVFFAVLADLWSGVRKAKQRDELRTSTGYKRTVEKLSKYYNVLFALTIIDAMQILGVWYLDNYYNWKVPLLPLFTLAGSIGIGLIELKSIYESANDKEFRKVSKLAGEMIRNKDDVHAVTDAIINYLNESKDDTKGKVKATH